MFWQNYIITIIPPKISQLLKCDHLSLPRRYIPEYLGRILVQVTIYRNLYENTGPEYSDLNRRCNMKILVHDLSSYWSRGV